MLELLAVQVVSIRNAICYNERVKKVEATSHNAMFVGRVVASIFPSR